MKIVVSALEASANIHLKALKKELDDSVEFTGVFDKSLGNPMYDISELAVMGFVDAIKRLPFFLNLKKEMTKLAAKADKVLLIDSSGFNLPLAKSIKKAYPDKEIIYYILPQAWAWKKGRVKTLQKYCDKLCSILPFESQIYDDKSKIIYAGHPLLDEIELFKQDIGQTGKIVYMPGSRKGEISKLMPLFKEISKSIGKTPVLVIPSSFSKEYIKEVYGDISGFEISHDTHKSLSEAEFAFVCSGTATLEAALIGTPFVLSYIAKPVDYFIGSRLVKLNFIGLANIFFEKMGKEPMHIELVQERVTVENLLRAYGEIDREKFLDNSKILREYLKHGSSKTVANIIQN